MIKIYQLSPTVVLETEAVVLKVFSTSDSCEEQVNVLSREGSPILSQLPTGEKLRLINIAWQKGSVLAMEPAKGFQLISLSHEQDDAVTLAAKLLAARHLGMAGAGKRQNGRLLGDFVIDHLFYDEASKTLTLIDPGMNFCIDGNLAEDCARFIFSVYDAFRWKPLKATIIVTKFINTYLSQSNGGKKQLRIALKHRFSRSQQKYKLQKSPMRAFASSLLLGVHYLMIQLNLHLLND